MPELPEVEVVRAGLERHVLGSVIESVEVLHPRPVRRDHRGSTGFVAALVGQRIVAVRRRGKYFWLALANGDALLGHLGMSGQMLLHEPGATDGSAASVPETVVTGAAVGAVLGTGVAVATKGGQIVLPAGQRLKVRLADGVKVKYEPEKT